jgi:branched-chain amino acid aminotransferase
MAKGTHEYQDDPRNAGILIYVNGELLPREQASVSVFDSGFVLGDGVWEGLRLHRGRLLFLDDHLDRLYAGARALDFDIGLDRRALTDALHRTVEANAMHDHVHIRLMVTRGLKSTPYRDPRMTVGDATIVIIPEHKQPSPEVAEKGVRLATVHVRRGPPDVQDPKINSHSKLNCILACIQATKAGADEALMLDPHGFVATCNSTHFFIVRGGEVWTRHHPGQRHRRLRAARYPGVSAGLQPLRCVRRGRGIRHGNLRRRRPGRRGGRAEHRRRRSRSRDGAPAGALS